MNKQSFLKVAVALIACSAAPDAFAADDCKLDPNADNVLGKLAFARSMDCFGGSADTEPLAVKIVAIKQCNTSTPEEVVKLRRQLAFASREIEMASNSLASRAPSEWAAVVGSLGLELQKSTSELQGLDTISKPKYWEWHDHEALQQDNGQFKISYGPIVGAKCPTGDRTKCAEALAVAVEVNRLVNLTRHLHACAGAERRTQVSKRLFELDAAWDKYFFGTRSQYVWELAINSARFKGRDDVFAEPPNDQLIVAHPGISFEYVGGGPQNSEAYQAVLMAELIGYNRFNWGTRNGKSSRLPPLGISIVGTYSPDNDGEHVGYGVMLHVNNVYSFGVAQRDTGAGNETVYLLSADLMKLILKPSGISMQNFRGAGSPTAGED